MNRSCSQELNIKFFTVNLRVCDLFYFLTMKYSIMRRLDTIFNDLLKYNGQKLIADIVGATLTLY